MASRIWICSFLDLPIPQTFISLVVLIVPVRKKSPVLQNRYSRYRTVLDQIHIFACFTQDPDRFSIVPLEK